MKDKKTLYDPYVNMLRSTESPELERRFFSRLVELGVPVAIETNA